MLGICIVKNPQFANVLDKVITTFNRGGGGAARVELGDILSVQIERLILRHTKGAEVTTLELKEPTVTTVFSPDMMFMTVAESNGTAHKLNIFRNRVRKKGPALYEIDTPTGKTEIAFI